MSQSQYQAVDQRQDSDAISPLDSDNLNVSSRRYAYTNVLIRSTIDLFSPDGVMNRAASLMTELGAGIAIRSVILDGSMGKYMSKVLSVHVVLLDMGQHCTHNANHIKAARSGFG